MQKGYVYLLTDGEFFKIGVTRSSIEKRIKKLQTGNADTISIKQYYQTDIPFKLEKALHTMHANQRVNNEWFSLSLDDVTNFTDECQNLESKLKVLSENNPYI